MLHRINVCFNLVLVTALSLIYIPFPDITGDIIFFLVKRVNRLVTYGEPECDDICEGFQPDGEDTCDVAADDESGDGEDGSECEDGSSGAGGHEPDGYKND